MATESSIFVHGFRLDMISMFRYNDCRYWFQKNFEKFLETLEQFGLSHAIYSRGVTLLLKSGGEIT